MRFVEVEEMRLGRVEVPKFDLVGRGIPLPALSEFFVKKLRGFYVKEGNGGVKKGEGKGEGVYGRLAGGWLFQRECIEPSDIEGKSRKWKIGRVARICKVAPEGIITKPSVLVNTPGGYQKSDQDFERFLQEEFKEAQGKRLRVLDAEMLFVAQDKLCFRSVIVSPGADHRAGQTIEQGADQGVKQEDEEEVDVKDALHSAVDALQDLRSKTFVNDSVRILMNEGGVEILSRKDMGESWMDGGPAVCRIHKVCRRLDGTLVAPEWMKAYQEDIESRCGLSAQDLAYIDNEPFDVAYEADRDSWTDYSEQEPGGPLSFDLLGARLMQPQPQHFMVDIMPHLHSLRALLRPVNTQEYLRSCIYRPGSTVGLRTATSRTCIAGKNPTRPLRPAFLVPDKVSSSGPAFRFTRQFRYLLPPGKVGPRFLYEGMVKHDGDDVMCFRSVVTVHKKLPLRSVLQQSNALYENNNMSSTDVREQFKNERNDEIMDHCKVVVKILEPRMRIGNYSAEDGRTFIWPVVLGNAEQLAASVESQVDHSLTAHQVTGFSVDVEFLHYDGTSVLQLLHQLQKVDILIAPHDPSLASLVFMRPGTTVIEIPPFAYYAGPYKKLAEDLNLDYVRMPASPDVTSFEACLRTKGELDWPDGTPEKTKKQAIENVIELFKSAVREFEDTGFSESLRLERSRGEARAQVPQERICARGQRLRMEIDRVAALIVERAGRRCKGTNN